jgi:hypothetical protein
MAKLQDRKVLVSRVVHRKPRVAEDVRGDTIDAL